MKNKYLTFKRPLAGRFLFGEQMLELLVGKIIKKITEDGHSMVFECTDGSVFEAYHMQDCCETVSIHDINLPDLSVLNGEEIYHADSEESSTWPEDVAPPDYNESFTWTTHFIKTKNNTLKVRWLGTSNGYYSESVYFQRTHPKIDLK